MKSFSRLLFLIAIFPFIFCGCHRNRAQYLINHPREFHAIIAHCESIGFSGIQNHPQCIYALALLDRMLKYTGGDQLLPQQFGNKILLTQMAMAKKEEEMNAVRHELLKGPGDTKKTEKLNDLKQEHQLLKRKVEIMVRLSAINEGM